MGFPTKLLGPDEHLVLVLRRHAKVLFWPAVLVIATVPAATFLSALVPTGDAQRYARAAIVLVAALVLLRWAVWPFLRWWTTTYAITDRRLVIRSGVFSRSGHDMPLSRLNDVSFSHGVIGRMLGFGTLVVESAGERGQLVLDEVPRVEQVQRTLYRLSDDVRDRAARGDRGGPDDDQDGAGYAAQDGDTVQLSRGGPRSDRPRPGGNDNPTIQFDRTQAVDRGDQPDGR
jgi:uncharacterized membrane protein YdbT with pleckstrin-like domain